MSTPPCSAPFLRHRIRQRGSFLPARNYVALAVAVEATRSVCHRFFPLSFRGIEIGNPFALFIFGLSAKFQGSRDEYKKCLKYWPL